MVGLAMGAGSTFFVLKILRDGLFRLRGIAQFLLHFCREFLRFAVHVAEHAIMTG